MKNHSQPGRTLDLIAPAGGVVSGVPVMIGNILVIPNISAAAGVGFTGDVMGVFGLPTDTGTAWNQMDTVYWNAGTGVVTKTAAGNAKIGFTVPGKLATDTTALVSLIPQP